VTSAFNEEQYLERTIQSVIAQTLLPMRWVIVSDGSTDGTDSLIRRYEQQHDFIVYHRIDHTADEPRPKFGFVAQRKANAISRAVELLSPLPYQYIANLDGDISFGPNVFEELMIRFQEQPRLGIAGGFIYNVVNRKLVPHFTKPENVAGALQTFRRECFEDIGGYVSYGHEDTIACFTAKMRGWEVRSFPHLTIEHHKVGNCSGWRRGRAKHVLGAYDYLHGDILVWELLRCAKETSEAPYVVGSCLRLAGYLKAMITQQKLLSRDFYRFVRAEQYRKLARAVLGRR